MGKKRPRRRKQNRINQKNKKEAIAIAEDILAKNPNVSYFQLRSKTKNALNQKYGNPALVFALLNILLPILKKLIENRVKE